MLARQSLDGLDNGSVIVIDERVVLGRVRAGDRPRGQVAETVMEPGPATVRAHEPLDELLDRMARRNVAEMIVAAPEGALLGDVRRPQTA